MLMKRPPVHYFTNEETPAFRAINREEITRVTQLITTPEREVQCYKQMNVRKGHNTVIVTRRPLSRAEQLQFVNGTRVPNGTVRAQAETRPSLRESVKFFLVPGTLSGFVFSQIDYRRASSVQRCL